MDPTSSDRIALSIDGRTAEVPAGTTILDAARRIGISIPTLCHYRGLSPYGACRICLVEIDTPRGPKQVASCSYPAEDNLVVRTDTPEIQESRRTVLELLLAQAPDSTELAQTAAELGVESTSFQPDTEGKCILCGLCVRTCNDLMGRGAISLFGRGANRKIATPFGEPSDQCQACGACALVCPTGAIDLGTISSRRIKPHLTSHDQCLTARPSIDLAHPQASPRVPVIDRENCVHFQTGDCGLCAEVCQADAVQYDQEEQTVELDVGAVVLTPGFEAFDATRRGEFGFGFAPNVVTNVQFERILSASGPTGGHIRRPSDGRAPKRLAFIQCVGSRDSGCDNDYCSSVCCMAATKEAILAKEHEPDLEVTIFFLDLRAFGKDFDRYCERAKKLGVRYIRSFISRTYEMPDTQSLRLVHVDDQMRPVEEEFDMVVLSLGLEPSASLRQQAERMDVVLNRWGFAQTRELGPLDASRPGVFVGGAFQEPKDIPDTVMQASAAACRAMELLAPARGSLVRTKTYPPERDITDEPPRIGVFVCHCGSNISSVVDVERVVERTRDLPYVVFAQTNVYTCADDSQDLIKEVIREHHLNRVIVASCTPRTHEPIFRDTLRDAGLNPYLLEMANIRDQCSWVHSADPEAATEKSCDLVRMAVGRAAALMPLRQETMPVESAALIVGGGIAGMTAALALADQGFPVHLIEKEAVLGGTVRHIHKTLDGDDVQAFLDQTIERVNVNPQVTVYLNARTTKIDGHIGAFTSAIQSPQGTRQIEHGVTVVATGGTEHKPSSFGYGKSDRILTQLELSDRMGRGDLDLPERPTIAMIQCVEQRSDERPYCSRVCCTTAVKNALLLKERYPHARIVVVYRDIRTYGFREAAYREAREKGVLFVRYEPEQPPVLEIGGKGRSANSCRIVADRSAIRPLDRGAIHDTELQLRIREPALGRDLTLQPDLVVLAAPMVPRADREELSELLRVPLNADGFFLEAHMKLRPVDFASEGLFLCGTAHAPKFISETISQAKAVAARAASILSKKVMPVGGQTAWVDPDKCISCMTCVHVCPYMAPMVDDHNKAQVQAASCMGCGSCTAECPARAISLRHFVDRQIVGAIDGLLGTDPTREPQDEERQTVHPERVGVAKARWRING
jgi:heterodisulfide reductase subunit A2